MIDEIIGNNKYGMYSIEILQQHNIFLALDFNWNVKLTYITNMYMYVCVCMSTKILSLSYVQDLYFAYFSVMINCEMFKFNRK